MHVSFAEILSGSATGYVVTGDEYRYRDVGSDGGVGFYQRASEGRVETSSEK